MTPALPMDGAPAPQVASPAVACRERASADTTDTALRGRGLALARAGWLVITVLAVGLMIATLPQGFEYFRAVCVDGNCSLRLTSDGVQRLREYGLSAEFYAACWLMVLVVSAGACCATAALLIRHSNERMALFAALMLVLHGVGFGYPLDSLVATQPGWRWVATALDIAGGAVFSTFFFLFPDGRFVPRWTRLLAAVALALLVARIVTPDWRDALAVPTVFGPLLAGIVTQVYRYRRVSSPAQRQQTKWVVFGTVVALGGFVSLVVLLFAFPSLQYDPLAGLAWQATLHGFLLLIPLSLALAILRHRLWDVDVIINRALVYGALTACIVGLYVLTVGYLSMLLRTGGNLAISLVATGLIAVLFQPLRAGLQRGVNRLLYGERDDPYAVLSRLGRRLEGTLAPDAVPPTIVEMVAGALKLPYVALALEQEGRLLITAAHGTPTADPVRLPLAYRNEPVGELLLAPRAPGEQFTATDRRLLDDLARQAGVAVHAVRLMADVQRANEHLLAAREQLVTAREEERRRLRRDLHDGLGPRLAGLTLRLETARDRLARDPEAEALLADLAERTRETVADIRRLVYALRPPVLDDLGLVSALREGVAQHSQAAGGDLRITVEAPDELPSLPAAVEVAAYRIVQEALTNVVRHAGARQCTVHLALDATAGVVWVEVRDDGCGLAPGGRTGVGLASMRERAEELGGTWSIDSVPAGGTRVRALLPCRHPATNGRGSTGPAPAREAGT